MAILPHTYLTAPQNYVSRGQRQTQQQHKGAVFWFTGLSGSGKSTIAHHVEGLLFQQKIRVVVLDGDVIRKGLCNDLGFSPAERCENIRRIAEMTKVMASNGIVCLCAFISPLHSHRELAQSILQDDYYEVFIECPLAECEKRDIKGYYALARQGKIKNYTGISAPYDVPQHSCLTIKTEKSSIEECAQTAFGFIQTTILF